MHFIDLGYVTPQDGIEAESRLLGGPSVPYGIIYTRDRPTVSLGHFSPAVTSVDTEYAEDHGISIIRRVSGGSAIYCDRNQITFSVITDRNRFADKEESYRILCGCLVKTLDILGIDAEYKPMNDVLVNRMKISGCAQYRDRSRLIHHGSLILRLDSETMDHVLYPVKERRYGRLTSIEECLGHIPEREMVRKAFDEGFAEL